MKYPQIIFFRHEKYNQIDEFIEENKEKWMCTFHITQDRNTLNQLFDSNYAILITYGETSDEYLYDVHSIIPARMLKRWLHFVDIQNIDSINHSVNNCYQSIVVEPHETTRPIFSLFTTCYNSYDKIQRAYRSIIIQKLRDWEWVIIDDSPDDKHFEFLRESFSKDKRIRLYRRSENSGYIGNVKNEVVSLCRGKYVLEMDHDDEILEDCLLDAATVFDADEDVGFIYMDFINIYENGANFSYGDFFGLGYEGYYRQKYQGRWVNVAMTANINNITLTHIVGVPNHPRIWRKSTLLKIGNYSEYLPICDDYELLMRTAVNTKMIKINKFSYVQYMNNGSSNFSLMWNAEISRLGPQYIKPYCFHKYKIEEKMRELGASESEIYNKKYSQIWKRDPSYKHVFSNARISLDYTKEYCILGVKTLMDQLNKIKELYSNPKHDFLILDHNGSTDELCNLLDRLGLDRMKCYVMNDCGFTELRRYYLFLYNACDNYEILE
jgi:glycosyltransferase involved in cell wall biosynthesis